MNRTAGPHSACSAFCQRVTSRTSPSSNGRDIEVHRPSAWPSWNMGMAVPRAWSASFLRQILGKAAFDCLPLSMLISTCVSTFQMRAPANIPTDRRAGLPRLPRSLMRPYHAVTEQAVGRIDDRFLGPWGAILPFAGRIMSALRLILAPRMCWRNSLKLESGSRGFCPLRRRHRPSPFSSPRPRYSPSTTM